MDHADIDHTGLTGVGDYRYHVHRILATIPNANETHAIDSTAYVASGAASFVHDWDAFPATHFLIAAYGQANEAAQTVTFQLTLLASPTNPISSAGNDLALTNSLGVFKSSWIAVSDATTGIQEMTLARKGSNSTVDFAGRWLEVHFKIA
jgi:hypothetical protein